MSKKERLEIDFNSPMFFSDSPDEVIDLANKMIKTWWYKKRTKDGEQVRISLFYEFNCQAC